jgi:hypothetical protein
MKWGDAMGSKEDKKFLHDLHEKYYGNRKQMKPRERCIRCGQVRVLGKRRPGKGLCKKCRKGDRDGHRDVQD